MSPMSPVNHSPVAKSNKDALKEFRIAHPPRYGCELLTEGICTACYTTAKDLAEHQKDKELHKELEFTKKDEQGKFQVVENIFLGKIKYLVFSKCILHR